MNVAEFPVEAQGVAPAPRPTRPMYWSIRRELWENRSVWIAPLVVTAVVLFATLIGTIGLPKKMRNLPPFDPAKQQAKLVGPYSTAPAPIMFVSFLVGMFYSVEALHGERRDRSILFWKSLPVSDRTAVLAKAAIPLAVLPLYALVLCTMTLTLLMIVSTVVLTVTGINPVRLWAEVRVFQEYPVMLYGLTVHALWFAPIYGWLLLVSAWARRAPFLWAFLPWFALAAFERMALSTTYVSSFLKYRWVGAMSVAFTVKEQRNGVPLIDTSQLTPLRFLTTPGLWVGLMFAAIFIAMAIRLRRNREPI